ncbi:VTT domain-containing protein [candidate division WWE3 bacterium]|nr:VTT domain-containing protein [candidate division WWE3 bacterium]
MKEVIDAFLNHDLIGLIRAVGLFGVWGMIFAESGLLIGFFLPGDSLLFTAGLLSSSAVPIFNIWHMILGSWVAAIVGDNVGYEFGKHVGRKLFRRQDSLLFKQENLIKAEQFYEKYGGKALVIARFVPVVRTFVPIVAGIGHMNRAVFMLYNFLGGTLWVFGVGFAGYFLGSFIPGVDKYLLPIVMGIILFSILPPIIEFYKESEKTPLDHVKEILTKVKYYLLSFIPDKTQEN